MWQDFAPELLVALVAGGLGWGGKAAIDRWKLKQPVSVLVDDDPRTIYLNDPPWVSFPQFVPEISASVPAPPSDVLSWGEWARRLGGMPAGYAEIQVTISSRVAAAVVVDGLRVHLVDMRPIPPGIVVHQPAGGADLIRRGFEVKLSDFAPQVQAVEAGSGEPTGNYAFTVSLSEPARLSIRVQPERRDVVYVWRAELMMSVNGARRIQPVGGRHRTFQLCGQIDPWHQWDGHSWNESGPPNLPGGTT